VASQILIDIERRPAKALKLLHGMDQSKLAPELQALHQKLCKSAEQLETEIRSRNRGRRRMRKA
jgi:hypothetical protein